MASRRFRLRVIALVAAYAVALQGLLSAFVPIAAAMPSGILCSGQSVDDPAGSLGHEPSCAAACAMLGTPAGPLPPAIVIAEVHGCATSQLCAPEAPSPAASTRGPHAARAPPLVRPATV